MPAHARTEAQDEDFRRLIEELRDYAGQLPKHPPKADPWQDGDRSSPDEDGDAATFESLRYSYRLGCAARFLLGIYQRGEREAGPQRGYALLQSWMDRYAEYRTACMNADPEGIRPEMKILGYERDILRRCYRPQDQNRETAGAEMMERVGRRVFVAGALGVGSMMLGKECYRRQTASNKGFFFLHNELQDARLRASELHEQETALTKAEKNELRELENETIPDLEYRHRVASEPSAWRMTLTWGMGVGSFITGTAALGFLAEQFIEDCVNARTTLQGLLRDMDGALADIASRLEQRDRRSL